MERYGILFLTTLWLSVLPGFAANPSLSIQQLPSGQIQIVWPGDATRFNLEQADELDVSISWGAVSETVINAGGNFSVTIPGATQTRFYRLRGELAATIFQTSPVDGESGVAVTRETILRFSTPLAANAALSTAMFYAEFGGRRLLTRPELSSDRLTATLFYQENLPASARVQVIFNGNGLMGANGLPLDADADGAAGGVFPMSFFTLGNTALENTAVIGRVYASELAPGGTNRPLVNATVTVDGAEQTLRAVTDTDGFFRLQPAPAGRFFVHIDGRTTVGSQWPVGEYYPFVGKAWEAIAGQTNNLAGGTGEIFLPLIPGDALRPVSLTSDTEINFSSSIIATNPAFAEVSITVPANALFSDNGTRGGKVGIAPVPPDRLPGPLPPGLEMPIVITVQTDGGANFDRPAPICFPNVTDPVLGAPLPAGSRQSLMSFNHDKGEWEAVGTMTVSADGKLICSDPGSGIRQPGWHGVGPGGSGPPPPPGGGGCGGPPGGGETARAKCIRRCGEDFEICAGACIAAAAAAMLACGLAGPGFPICAGGVLAAQAICQTACLLTYDRCTARCREDNPCPPKAGALSWVSPASAQGVRVQMLQAAPVLDPKVEQIEQLVHQIGSLAYAQAMSGEPLPADRQAQVQALIQQMNTVAGGDAAAYLRDVQRQLEETITPLEAEIGEDPGNAPEYPVLYMAEVQRSNGEILRIRGKTLPFGQYTVFVPRDGVLRYVSFYDPLTARYGVSYPHVRPSAPYALPRFTLIPVNSLFPDTDADGLVDAAEFVYGTAPGKKDSDGDGIPDGAEVDQGTNPLDGLPTQQGILASVMTLGAARDVCAFNNFAVVAEGEAGVSIFDATDYFNPVRVAQVNTPGLAQGVACEGDLVAVADGTNGLVIIDISDRANSFIARQVPLPNAISVNVSLGIAFVGLDGGVAAVEMATGRVLSTAALEAGRVEDVLAIGDTVYALKPLNLYTFSFKDGTLKMTSQASVGLPGDTSRGRVRLSAGKNLLYAVYFAGFRTFSLNDPLQPVEVQGILAPQRSWRQIVPNGSGLGVAAIGVNATDGTHDVYLYDLNPGGTNNVFVTVLPTPGYAAALSIFNGLAYVADGPAGLQVVNYLAADTAGQPPTIQLGATFKLSPPARAASGALERLTAEVTDDVQVRNVEFYVDDIRIAADGNFPFEIPMIVPLLSSTKTNFTIRARATDTGGNATWTAPLTVELVLDDTPPVLTRVSPKDGGKSVDRAIAYFSEPIKLSTVNSETFRIVWAGADGQFDTVDDFPITVRNYSVNLETFSAEAEFLDPLPEGRYRMTLTTGIADLTGNFLAAPVSRTFVVGDAIFWTGSLDNAWERPLNWDPAVVPGPADRVVIPSGAARIASTVRVRRFESFGSLEINLGSLEAADGIILHRDTILNRGTLRKSLLTLADGAILRVSNQNWTELDDMTISGDIDMGNEGQLILRNRLTLQGTLRGTSRAFLQVEGAATFARGTLEFNGGAINLASGAVWTVAPDAVLSGNLVVQGPGALLNDGLIRPGANGGISVVPAQFTHRGTAEVPATGQLTFGGQWGGDGRIDVQGGRLLLDGEFGPTLPPITQSQPGFVEIVSVVDLQGGALTLNATTGSWRLLQGGFRNGTLNLLEGTELRATSDLANLLENMTVNGLLAIDQGYLTVRGGLSLNGTLRERFGSQVRFEGVQTVTGGVIDVQQAAIVLPEGASLTLSDTTVVNGDQGAITGPGTLVNLGVVQAPAGKSLLVSAAVVQRGTLRAETDSVLTLSGSLTGPNPISVAGRLILDGPLPAGLPPIQRSGNGNVVLRSVADLQGGSVTFDAARGGWWLQSGGGFRNGTINVVEGVRLQFDNAVFENITLNGSINLFRDSAGSLTVRGGLALTGTIQVGGTLTFEGVQTLASGAIQVFDGARVVVPANAQLTLGPLSLLRGAGAVTGEGALHNAGKISADVANATLSVTVTTFSNTGALEQINGGTLIAPGFP